MPHELYGKFTWRIEDFSEINKRELRSNVFEVGSYKWCAHHSSVQATGSKGQAYEQLAKHVA